VVSQQHQQKMFLSVVHSVNKTLFASISRTCQAHGAVMLVVVIRKTTSADLNPATKPPPVFVLEEGSTLVERLLQAVATVQQIILGSMGDSVYVLSYPEYNQVEIDLPIAPQ